MEGDGGPESNAILSLMQLLWLSADAVEEKIKYRKGSRRRRGIRRRRGDKIIDEGGLFVCFQFAEACWLWIRLFLCTDSLDREASSPYRLVRTVDLKSDTTEVRSGWIANH